MAENGVLKKMFLSYNDILQIAYKFSLITLHGLILAHKEKCIFAARYARENKDFEPVYKTCIIYAKQHFEIMKKIKEQKNKLLKWSLQK